MMNVNVDTGWASREKPQRPWEAESYSMRMKPSGYLNQPAGPLELHAEAIMWRGLREHVYDSILELLLRGETPSGTRLSINTIAQQLGVSPTPVREALVQLERTGLVTREANKGYRVAPPLGRRQLAELFQARQMLEETAASLAAAHASSLLPELRAAHERHRLAGEAVIAALDTGVTDVALAADYYARDRDFHDVIFRHSGNRYLVDMSDGLGALMHRLRQSVHRGVTDVREAISEHESIIDAFTSGEPGRAEQAMRAHIENVRDRELRDGD
jgi:DNA-binding GntR family transcriptional regulator